MADCSECPALSARRHFSWRLTTFGGCEPLEWGGSGFGAASDGRAACHLLESGFGSSLGSASRAFAAALAGASRSGAFVVIFWGRRAEESDMFVVETTDASFFFAMKMQLLECARRVRLVPLPLGNGSRANESESACSEKGLRE